MSLEPLVETENKKVPKNIYVQHREYVKGTREPTEGVSNNPSWKIGADKIK